MSAPEDDASSTFPDAFQEEQTMLILVGLVASGKSTFADALEGHFPRFRRCNQDDLGSRQRVEELAYHTLREGRSPCIDRTNFNAVQRSYWSAIARAFPETSISIIVFDTPYHVRAEFANGHVENKSLTFVAPLLQVCASRLQRRIAHPTIRDAQHGVAVLQKFASDFQVPSPGEGYDHIIYIRPEDHPRPEYTRDDVLSILERLKASTRDSGTNFGQSSSRGYSRTDQTRGHRGRDGYRAFSPARGTLYGPSRFMRRGERSNWRRPGLGVATDRERSNQWSAVVAAHVPPKEGSKGSDSAEDRHNCS